MAERMIKPQHSTGRFLSDAELTALAGAGAFARGRVYWREQRVRLSRQSADALAGEATGSDIYALWLQREGKRWTWDCSCPAAEDGAFCKHLVAAVLTARDGDEPMQPLSPVALRMQMAEAAAAALGSLRAQGGPAPATRTSAKRVSPGRLGEFLHAQPAERLAGWLLELAEQDRGIDKRLRLYQAGAQPEALKAALGKLLDPGRFLDYRGSMRYAERLDGLLETLQTRLAEDPVHARELCEYALGRLFKIYERSDDSAGAIGERMHEIAQLHARACVAAPPAAALAKPLYALQCKDGWGMVKLADYWDALGAEGRIAYGKLVLAEFERLPVKAAKDDAYGSGHAIRARTEAYARASRDFELLQRVLRWRLEYPGEYLQVLDSLREFGREREALDWAEAALKRFPRDPQLHAALAECLHAAGLDSEALEHCWQAFRLRPDSKAWDALKQAAGTDWPQWRVRALEGLAKVEGDSAATRVHLLQHDGDLAAAIALARQGVMFPDTLLNLAKRVQRDDPETAGELMLRAVELQLPRADAARYAALVRVLKNAARLLPAARWQPFVATLRTAYGKRPKLMALLAEAGL